jgi:hypothetical protein
MRRICSVFLAVAAVAVGSAAGLAPASAGEPPAEPPTPKIQVTDPGSQPRRALRLRATEGQQYRTLLTLRLGLEQEINGETMTAPIPPIRYELGVSVTDVSRNRVTSTFSIEALEAVDDGSVDPSVLEQIADELEPLAELEGEFTVNGRGAVVEADLDIPSDLDAAARASLEQFAQQLSTASIPLPRARVGLGATWTGTTSVRAGGIDSKLVYTYELVELDGDAYGVAIEYEQTAEPQDVELPGVADDIDARLEEFDVSGSGEMTGDLTSPFATSGTITASGDQVLTGEGDVVNQTLEFEVTIESGPE